MSETEPLTQECMTDHLRVALDLLEQWLDDCSDDQMWHLLRVATTEFDFTHLLMAFSQVSSIIVSGSATAAGATNAEAIGLLRSHLIPQPQGGPA